MHLALGLNGAGWHPAAHSEGTPEIGDADFWLDAVVEAERGLLDFVTIEDVPADGASRPRLDSVLLASRVATHTSHIGLVPVITADGADPYHVARAISVLDYTSAGRAGVALRTGSGDAHRYVAELDRIWDGLRSTSGQARARLVDASTLNYISFAGEHFSVLGPDRGAVAPVAEPVAFSARSTGLGGDVDFTDVIVVLDITGSAARARSRRLEAIAADRFAPAAGVFVGTPSELVDLLTARFADGSGCRLLPASAWIDLPLIARQVVPLLQERGAFRTAYADESLRERLGATGTPRSRRIGGAVAGQ